MTGQQLKNSILQLAIQGKLVPQNPDDEPASELLKRIRKEKEKLVKEKKLKKSALDVTPISEDEKPFEIPEGWEWCRVKNIVLDSDAGKSPNCEKRPKTRDEWGVLTTTSIQNCFFLPEENKVLPCGYIVKKEQQVFYGDILITRAGPRNRTGIVCVANKECENLILSDKTIRLKYLEHCINPFYVMYALNSPELHALIMESTVGMAESQVNVSQDNIKHVLFPLPPLQEQHRIVEKIEELMPLVDEYDKAQKELNTLNANLPEALKKSILQEAIQGKLGTNNPDDESASELLKRIREEKAKLIKEKAIKKEKPLPEISEDEKPFDIPENWVWCRLGDILRFVNGRAYKKEELLPSGKYKVLRVGNFFTNDSWYISVH